ncbi:MAG: flagellar motor switch protein FliN/FliY [Kiritimatiellia bacterium]|jgi:flagellar motor switch protein FliN/FliY
MSFESHANVTFLHGIPIEMVVELGRARLTVRELSQLHADDVIELDRTTDEPLDIIVGGRVLARGEVVIVDDRISLRIVEIVNQKQAEMA